MTAADSFDLGIARPPATLREIVQDKLREAILTGHFKPGERLVERPLCDQLGVSRTVIRETIRTLEAEGLVESLPHKGPIVARMGWEDARQIYDIRLLLESSAAQACARANAPALPDQLTAALAHLKDAYSGGQPAALLAATSALYRVIFETAGHHIAWEIVQRLNGRISRLRAITLSTSDRHTSGFAHMVAICSAIQSGDARAADRAVRAHITDARAIAKRALTPDPA